MTLDGVYIYNENEKSLKKELRPNTKDVTETQQSDFLDFGLQRNLLKGIYAADYIYPSPIQKQAIPPILEGQHVLARAKNGTGKTGAYAIPALNIIDGDLTDVQVLVIVPSRELALQTNDVFEKLSKFCDVQIVLSIGGTPVTENIEKALKSQIMVGTPGRILHLIKMKPKILEHCRLCVIDEADVLLSNHFLESVQNILSVTDRQRQILLFSATFPLSVKNFSDAWMKDSTQINTMDCLTLRGVTPFYVYLDESEKLKCLWYLISKLNVNQSIIFVNTVSRAEELFYNMKLREYNCVCIHSQMNQDERSDIYNSFKRGNYRHLVSTNLFTRGIDIAAVNVVINFDFPTTVETYLHRIGRSGRFGQVGLSIEMVTDNDKANFYKTEDYLDIDVQKLPEEVDLKLYN